MESTTTDRRIIGHMVTRNERSRYLAAAIGSLKATCDRIAVYDDDSSDGTYEYLRSAQVFVRRRLGVRPSFAEDESGFRATGWRLMENWAKPARSDWILCLDADEVLVTDPPSDLRGALDRLIDLATADGAEAVSFKVDEVFDLRHDGPYVRTDGFWSQIQACRLVRWRPNAVFQARREGGGSAPTSWIDWGQQAGDVRILHFGYARQADRQARYDRYRLGNGHNRAHIESILAPPELQRWAGDLAGMSL